MNEDTIFLNARGEQIPRAKRVKREGHTQGSLTSFRFKPYQIPTTPKGPLQDGRKKSTKGQPEAADQSTIGKGDTQEANTVGDRDNMEQSSTSAGAETNNQWTSVNAVKHSTRARRPTAKGYLFKAYTPPDASQTSKRAVNAKPQSREAEISPHAPSPRQLEPTHSELPKESRINFSTAPEDPVELAWWLAHQISHFENVNTSIANTGEGSSIMYEAELSIAYADKDNQIKEQARKRQQKWRANHRERKTLNDLRSRLNREAKQKFGLNMSAKRTAWIEEQFIKRRNKLETKQRLLASQAGKYPELKIAREVRASMVAKDSTLSTKEQEIRSLIVDLLFPRGQKSKASLTKTAKAFLAAVGESNTSKDEILSTVLKGIADTSEAMKSIRAEVATDEVEVDESSNPNGDGSAGLEGGATSLSTRPKNPGKPPMTAVATPPASSESIEVDASEMMKAINDAVAILAQINDAKSRPSSRVKDRQEKSSQKKGAKSAPTVIDLDVFLVTANAGPLNGMQGEVDEEEEDEDYEMEDANEDETVPDQDEETDEDDPTNAGDTPDSAVWSSINQLIDQLVSKRLEFDAKTRNKSGFNARAQAKKARKLLENANLRANFAMTKANSKAISHLYTQLVGLLSKETQVPDGLPTGDVDHGPEPITPVSTKPAPTKKAKAKAPPPPPKPLPPLPAKYNLPLPSPSQGVRTEEEQRKIKSYGFPPLPGRKVGTPRG